MRYPTELLSEIYRFDDELFFDERVGRYLINLPEQIVLIDIPRWSKHSAEFVRGFEKPIVCISTHGSTLIADAAIWQRALSVTIALHILDKNHPWIAGVPDRLLTKPVSQIGRLQIIHTPGHSKGSVCILDPETKALFTGDTVAGTANGQVRDPYRTDPHDEDSATRLTSVLSLTSQDFDSILPFHYKPIIGGANARLRDALRSKNRRLPRHTDAVRLP